MKTLILGHGHHGKDTAARLLTEAFGTLFASSSEVAGRIVVYPVLKPKYSYQNFEQCHADRANHRHEWADLIAQFNSPDKSRLAGLILKSFDGYIGMRRQDEFDASKHLFDLILWVDASQRLPLDPTMEIEYDPTSMITIDNNSNMNNFKINLISKTQEYFQK